MSRRLRLGGRIGGTRPRRGCEPMKINDTQIKYIAEALKLAAISQAAAIGLAALNMETPDYGLFWRSLTLGISMLLVGVEILSYLSNPND